MAAPHGWDTTDRRRAIRDLMVLAVTAGLGGGLIEGLVHIGLQSLGIPDNSWYPIIWIAAVFNGLLVGGMTLVLAPLVWVYGYQRRVREVAVFLVLLAASTPWLVLLLKNWIALYAVALVALGIVLNLARVFNRHPDAAFRFSRKSAPVMILITLVALAVIEGGSRLRESRRAAGLPAAEPSSPNVLLVVVDALRADHLSGYGYHRKTSPNIDRLAQNGVVFDNAFSTSSYTLPTHASILTGLLPSEHGVSWDTAHHGIRMPTVPEVLATRGYRTGAFSANTFYFTRELGFGRGFLHFDDFFHSLADRAWRTAYGGIATRLVRPLLGWDDLPARRRAEDINQAVTGWAAKDARRPFFIMVNYMDAHDPYLPPQPFRGRFAAGGRPGGLLNFKRHVPDTLTPDQVASEMAAYDGAIAYVDHAIGQLVESLGSADRDLLVIVTSDHGEEFGEHGGFLHARHLYREAVHVPLIMWRPGYVPEGTRLRRPVSHTALPSTIMALTGTVNHPFLEPSLSQFWTGESEPAGWPLPLMELTHRPWAPERDPVHFGTITSLVDLPWQYIRQDNRGEELFDWIADPTEATNLADTPRGRQAIAQLRSLLK